MAGMRPGGARRTPIAVIGLDGVPPHLVFDAWRDRLPNLRRLMDRGAWGPLRSCHPPITVPAWASMFTGRDPGQLGLYGFRQRHGHRAAAPRLVDSSSVGAPRVWDLLSRAGWRSLLLGVPQTYPPPAIDGFVVSCFLTPSRARSYTYPESLAAEVERVVPGYVFDVDGFRDQDRRALLQRLYDKTEKHFRLARHLVRSKPWDFFAMVEMGPDRLHHGFWRHSDAQHPRHEAGSDLAAAIPAYYEFLDAQIGGLLADLDPDVRLLVVSDHGATRFAGGIFINEWLREKGYLTLRHLPPGAQPLQPEWIDWSRTRAWAEGGYSGRLYLNLRGRDHGGVVAPEDAEPLLCELIDGLGAIPDPFGRPLATEVLRPQAVYREVNGVAPDLLVYFGDLQWRALGSVGGGRIHSLDNDRGADDANHDWDGICIVRDGQRDLGGRRRVGWQIADIAPTILGWAGMEAEAGMAGTVIDTAKVRLAEDDQWEVRRRLEALGYI